MDRSADTDKSLDDVIQDSKKRPRKELSDSEKRQRISKETYTRRNTDQVVGKRVWVGNLSFKTSWQELKDHMRAAGNVLYSEIFMEQDGYRSKGCGVVEYESEEEARKAIDTLFDSTLNGRKIIVREDREEGKGRDAARTSNAALFVTNLPYTTSWQDLKDKFKVYGPIVRADVHTDGNRSKGNGTVIFQNEADAKKAIEGLDQTSMDGRPIYVRWDRGHV